ncbi:MAG: hypothetical protein FWC89_01955 [Defluviitaleaceae bacterium]|nr:hypothetical protein [Defluviitaleaceae bacterium]
MSYQLNRAHLLICIFAALVVTGGFVWHLLFGLPSTLAFMAWWVSVAIVLFYVIGQFARSILIKQVFVPNNDEYDLSDDPEYQAFMASLNNEAPPTPTDVMFSEPLQSEPMMELEPMPMMDYDDTLSDPFMEPMPLNDAS